MPATVRETVANSSAGLSGNMSVTTSSATTAGDLLVAFRMAEYSSAGELPAPTGTAGTWTARFVTPTGGYAATSCYTRPVTAAGAQTITVAGNSDTPGTVLTVAVVTGVTAVGNTDSTNQTTASTSHTAPTVTAVNAGELLLTVHSGRGGFTYSSIPASMTSQSNMAGGSAVRQLVCSQALTAAGATGTRTATASSGSSSYATGSILLRGSASSPGAWLAFFP